MDKETIIEGNKHLTKDEAIIFFSEFYRGEHHIPGKITEFGHGWQVKHDRGDIATFDYNKLTTLVLMAHDKCIRVSIMPYNFNTLKICIWKRNRNGGFSNRHPTIQQAIDEYNSNTPKQ